MNITLNIGLTVSKNYAHERVADLEYEYVKDYLNQVFGKPLQIGLAQSATEKTVVVSYSDAEDVLKKLSWIAYVLKQDCIAYAIQDGGRCLGGALVGEYAHEWNYGLFDKQYFIEAL